MRKSKPSSDGCSCISNPVGPLRQDDPAGFEFIYRCYCNLVHRLCLRMLQDPVEAEDAVQDVFLRVFCKIDTFRGESAFSSWLYRLTTNIVLMRFRKNKHNLASLTEITEDRDLPCREIGQPDRHANSLVLGIDLQQAINTLPDGYKAAVILHDVQGYDHKEIADIFGCSTGNSKSQLHKARKRLRQMLGNNRGAHQNVGVAPIG